MQSVPITTKVVSSNHDHGEVYSIQHICDKVCLICDMSMAGADPGFQVRGVHLKKLGISCEKSRFYAKKSYFLA